MMIRTLASDQLAAAVAVARERSFSRAARSLGRTQSAVSQAVARLERELGERLFLRSARTTEPTAAGRTLLDHARRILDLMEGARASLKALGALEQGSLVVGSSDTLAYYALPPVLAAFRARHPGIELRLDNRPSPATAARVAERQVDVGVVSLPLPPDLEASGRRVAARVQLEPLAPQRDVVICPPGHPLARRRRVALPALVPYGLVLLDATTGSRAFLDAELARAGARPRVVMEMSSVEVLKRLVELGMGISLVPELAVEREVSAGVLAAVQIEGVSQARSIGLVTPSPGPASPAARAFAEIARAVLARGARAGRTPSSP
jgi:DNA-binding transcriptional LysR family regulator